MPELMEQMFCSQQIVVPPKFPYILKRYCKAAIKTQPYDLLRWSYEYFNALAQNRPPPVKLRLEYPVFSTEGGLTRGCLRVLANQLMSTQVIPLRAVKAAWQGFCLDPRELKRILCLCEVYLRRDDVPFLHFIAVAAGYLTKCLTHTMILLCECLTKEPDGGSAAIPVADFLTMYRLLARIDASKDINYLDGYREGEEPKPESVVEESLESDHEDSYNDYDSDDYWQGDGVQRVSLIDASVGRTNRLSLRSTLPVLGKIERSPSAERDATIDWENYQRDRKGKPKVDEEVNKKLREMSAAKIEGETAIEHEPPKPVPEKVAKQKKDGIEIIVHDEDENEIPFKFYGEPVPEVIEDEEFVEPKQADEETKEDFEPEFTEKEKVEIMLKEFYKNRQCRIEDMESTFDEIAKLVDRWKSANYDLGMVGGRMMSTTSGEYIVQQIERDIMRYVDDQIAVLPDPDLKKKKARPEEVAMVHELLETFLEENMDVIAPELEVLEEEEQPIPDIVFVYAVPGIGPPVDPETVKQFEDYAVDACRVQADVIMPRNIRHFLCPPLEKYVEVIYDKEEVPAPTGGTIGE